MDERGGGFCGCLILLLAIFGGYQLFQRVTADGGCDGWETWARATGDRFTAMQRQTVSLDPYTLRPQDLRDFAQSLREEAQTQLDTEPPDAARELSSETAEFYRKLADSYSAVANGSQPPYDQQELEAAAAEVTRLMDEANERCA